MLHPRAGRGVQKLGLSNLQFRKPSNSVFKSQKRCHKEDHIFTKPKTSNVLITDTRKRQPRQSLKKRKPQTSTHRRAKHQMTTNLRPGKGFKTIGGKVWWKGVPPPKLGNQSLLSPHEVRHKHWLQTKLPGVDQYET